MAEHEPEREPEPEPQREHVELEAALGERFTVLSGFRAPGSRSVFDHVTIGPAGVFVVQAFDEPGRIRVRGQLATLNGESILPLVQGVRRQALALQLLLADRLAELELRVAPVVWVRAARLGMRRAVTGVRLASTRDLRNQIARANAILADGPARDLTSLAEARLISARGLSA